MEKKYLKSYVEKVDKDSGEIYAVASTEAEDRDGDVILNEAWDLKNYKKNPLLLWSHDIHSLPIGKITNITNKTGRLEFKAKLAKEENEFANKIAKLMEGGFLNAFSVGYLPKEYDKKGRTSLAELLEISIVNVPANQEALVSREYKSFQEELKSIENELNKKKDDDKDDKDDKKETKSPACRMTDETKAECVSRKISEIMKEDPKMSQDQAVAIANSVCSKACKEDNNDLNKVKEIVDKLQVQVGKINDTLNTQKKVVARKAKKRTAIGVLQALRVVDKAIEQAIVLTKKIRKGGVK